MAEVPWFVQSRKGESEGRPNGCLQLSHKGSEGADADLFSVVTRDRNRGNGVEL